MTEDLIIGAGGGGGGGGKGGGSKGGGTPSEAKDNLNSTSYANVLDLIGEGEIEGFATPSKLGLTRDTTTYNTALLKDVYFNNTPVLRENASVTSPQTSDYAFKGFTIQPRYGTQAQSYIPQISSVEAETAVNIKVLKDTPITETITDPEVDAVRVTINVPSLQVFTDRGDIVGSSVRLKILVDYIQENESSGYTTAVDDTIAGRTGDAYQRDYIVKFTQPFDSVNIKVERVTDDSSSSKLANDIYFYSYTKIIYAKLKYPNTAYLALRIDAEQFSSIPSRTYRVRGIKVPIPSNATVDISNGRLTYSGIWNGTFQSAKWCSDPAWCLWALLTNSRWGFGDYIQAAQLDRWSFYEASKYCNELVPDGITPTGVEPRFSINANIQSRQEAYRLINDMCSVMRAMPYWSTGALTIAQDKPQDPAYLFSLANVEDGFSYSGASLKTRHTVAIVKYLDVAGSRDSAYEVVEDQEGIAKYGVNTAEVEAFSCTSRGQARRVGEWLLYTDRYSEIISFTASLDAGVVVRPGQVISVADPVRAGSRKAGRINSATTTAITVDDTAQTDLNAAPGAMLSVILPNGTVEQRQVASINAAVITVLSAFSQAPQANSIWMLEDPTLEASTWRVLGIKEEDGVKYSISAIAYNSSKYDYIEQNKPLTQRDITNLNVAPDTPVNLAATEVFYVVGSRVLTKLVITWAPVKGISNYRVRYRAENNNWSEEVIKGPSYDVLEVVPGIYQIEVYSISASQILSSDPATLNYNAAGVGAKPGIVTGVSLTPVNDTIAIIQWDLAEDLDVLIGGKVLIHHDPQTGSAASWNTSNPIVQAAAGNQTQKQVPLLDGTYFLRFEDSSGNRSTEKIWTGSTDFEVNTVRRNSAQTANFIVVVAGTSGATEPTWPLTLNSTVVDGTVTWMAVGATDSVVATLPSPQPRTTVKTWAEQSLVTPFTGVGTNMFYEGLYAGLVLDYTTSFTGGLSDTSYTSLDTVDGGASNTNYTTLNVINGGLSGLDNPLLSGGLANTNYTSLDTADGGVSNTNYASLNILDGTFIDNAYEISVTQTGEYAFKDTLDLGAVYDLNLKRRIVSAPVAFGTLWDDIAANIDDLADVDGEVLDVVAGSIYVRSTNDNPAGTPTWGAWNEIVNGIVRGRGFQLKLKAESGSPAVMINVTELGATAELQQRTEQSDTLASGTGAGGYSVTFANAFYSAPAVSITPLNMATGDYFTLGTPTATGFTVTFKASGGAIVDRNFIYNAVGYGRRI